jgi:hypothetical protein
MLSPKISRIKSKTAANSPMLMRGADRTMNFPNFVKDFA